MSQGCRAPHVPRPPMLRRCPVRSGGHTLCPCCCGAGPWGNALGRGCTAWGWVGGASLEGVISPHGALKPGGCRVLVCPPPATETRKSKGRFCNSRRSCMGKWQQGAGEGHGSAMGGTDLSCPRAASHGSAKAPSLSPAAWPDTRAGPGATFHQGGGFFLHPGWPRGCPNGPAAAGTLGCTQLLLPKGCRCHPAPLHLPLRRPHSPLHPPAATSPQPQPRSRHLPGAPTLPGAGGGQRDREAAVAAAAPPMLGAQRRAPMPSRAAAVPAATQPAPRAPSAMLPYSPLGKATRGTGSAQSTATTGTSAPQSRRRAAAGMAGGGRVAPLEAASTVPAGRARVG